MLNHHSVNQVISLCLSSLNESGAINSQDSSFTTGVFLVYIEEGEFMSIYPLPLSRSPCWKPPDSPSWHEPRTRILY